MDYLQYFGKMSVKKFKYTKVLNLIINGLPSILIMYIMMRCLKESFKPYYKWITFNTHQKITKKFQTK